ncbi:MAG: hypothetical protein FJW32_15515 [Acidobacteria bacterium]|nr:hypothetical protein [Acidobacteriota bacterium]
MRQAIAAILTVLLAALSNGTLMLACPQTSAPSCHRSQERTHPHCPFTPRAEQCPLLNDDLVPGEYAAKVSTEPTRFSFTFVPEADVRAVEVAGWHHSQDLHIRIRVLRI